MTLRRRVADLERARRPIVCRIELPQPMTEPEWLAWVDAQQAAGTMPGGHLGGNRRQPEATN